MSLINFCYFVKVYILLNIWIVGINLMKLYYHALKSSIVAFEMKNLGDSHDLYESDNSLMCDVFEKFRNTCSKW